MNELKESEKSNIVNIHAGFDETSVLLQARFKNSKLIVFDFYEPLKHTEPSIKRARMAYPKFAATEQVNSSALPLENNTIDKIFIIFSAHEIRKQNERALFFGELKRILKSNGEIIIMEHLRDTANFLAFNIGFFHFYSKRSWKRTFQSCDLIIKKEIKITPLISTFILTKNGNSL